MSSAIPTALIRGLKPVWVCLLMLVAPANYAGDLQVMVSIKPLHSLVSAVMQGVAEPILLQDQPDSPHQHSLKPSNAKKLANADLLFWLGPAMSAHFSKAVDTLLPEENSINVLANEQLSTLSYAGDRIEDLSLVDPHVWLDPNRASIIAQQVASVLSERDPANQSIFEKNNADVQAKLVELNSEISTNLNWVQDTPLLVMHSAYQYFALAYDINQIASLLNDDDHAPSAKRVLQVNQIIKDKGIQCMLVEPQYNQKIVNALPATLSTTTIDPIGVDIDSGPEHYFQLLRKLATGFNTCAAQNK